ncbi:MAG TPA: 16S rRNA (guanine(966)-N(2))-methyltransferase RsmD [Bacillota bacterium]|nr:16S rRNA (guanine(966)-N(2))-methyltransferase RsmD [Bacillota bacterium]
MRVIAGTHRGRLLKAVPGDTTRPTTDKIKEAVFHMLGPFFQGGTCIDLFAGSGALGIEALSRGIDHAIFIDKSPKAIHTIHRNLKALQLADRSEVFRTDAIRALHATAKRELTFDLILLDPPYRTIDYDTYLEEIVKLNLVNEDGLIYCEHDPETLLPSRMNHLVRMKYEKYGSTTSISIYQRGRQS